MNWSDLKIHEQLAFGGLVRILVRLDGSFQEEEEAKMNAVGDRLGGHEQMWRMISASAQAFPNDDAAKEAATKVERPEARALIIQVLGEIAEAGGVEAAEAELLEWLDSNWK